MPTQPNWWWRIDLKTVIIMAMLGFVINRTTKTQAQDADGGKSKEYYKDEVPLYFLRPGINKAKQETIWERRKGKE